MMGLQDVENRTSLAPIRWPIWRVKTQLSNRKSGNVVSNENKKLEVESPRWWPPAFKYTYISVFINNIATKFQWLCLCFRAPAINKNSGRVVGPNGKKPAGEHPRNTTQSQHHVSRLKVTAMVGLRVHSQGGDTIDIITHAQVSAADR